MPETVCYSDPILLCIAGGEYATFSRFFLPDVSVRVCQWEPVVRLGGWKQVEEAPVLPGPRAPAAATTSAGSWVSDHCRAAIPAVSTARIVLWVPTGRCFYLQFLISEYHYLIPFPLTVLPTLLQVLFETSTGFSVFLIGL